MKLYHLINEETSGYDTYSDMVIAAESEEDAVHLSKVKANMYTKGPTVNQKPIWRHYYKDVDTGCWAKNPTVSLIAKRTIALEGVVCSSFHSG